MEKLIKPVEYARQMGISRQAVYAKIKKGLLPSRQKGGKIYIILDSDEAAKRTDAGISGSGGREEGNIRGLLEAKDETISVLKETIRDLKETNRMITSTLRSEVELLKEAFGEMKSLYAGRLEHIREEKGESIPIDDLVHEAETEEQEEKGWIELEAFLEEQGIGKKKLRKAFLKRVKKLDTSNAPSVRRKNKKYLLSAEKAVELLMKIRS